MTIITFSNILLTATSSECPTIYTALPYFRHLCCFQFFTFINKSSSLQLNLSCILVALKYMLGNGIIRSRGMPLKNSFWYILPNCLLGQLYSIRFLSCTSFEKKNHKYDFMGVGHKMEQLENSSFDAKSHHSLFLCSCPFFFFQQLDFQNDWKLINVFFRNSSRDHLCPSTQQVNRRLGGRGLLVWGWGQWERP